MVHDQTDGPNEASPIPDIVASLRRAFFGAPTALNDTPVDGRPRTFALQSNAYYHLDVYLQVGLALPSSTDRFKRTFPAAQLSALIKHDPHIYNVRTGSFYRTALLMTGLNDQDIETCFVEINQHCRDFNHDCFSKFITVSHSIIGFCETFERRVHRPGGLKEQFTLLTDETANKSSDAYHAALFVSEAHASALSNEAKGLREECDDLVKHLHSVSRSSCVFRPLSLTAVRI